MGLKVLEMPVKKCGSIDKTVAAVKKLKEKPDKILILYTKASGGAGSLDNDLTIAECLYMVDLFKHWLLNSALRTD